MQIIRHVGAILVIARFMGKHKVCPYVFFSSNFLNLLATFVSGRFS